MGRYVISSALIWGPMYLGPQPKNLKHKEKMKQKMRLFISVVIFWEGYLSNTTVNHRGRN